jgi:hypothetical protein
MEVHTVSDPYDSIDENFDAIAGVRESAGREPPAPAKIIGADNVVRGKGSPEYDFIAQRFAAGEAALAAQPAGVGV